MKYRLWLLGLSVLAGACATPAVVGSVTIDEWCRATSPEECFLAASAVASGLDPICLANGPTYQEVVDGCSDDQPPVTTIPGPAPSTTGYDLEAIEAAVETALISSHPDGRFIVVLQLPERVSMREASALAASIAGELVAVWRTDEVCVTGFGAEGTQPSRFAYVDGVSRAAKERAAAEAASTPITGRHIVEALWDRMAEEAEALLEPGVALAAVAVDVRIGDIPAIRADSRFAAVNLAHPTSLEFSVDLEPATPADCG